MSTERRSSNDVGGRRARVDVATVMIISALTLVVAGGLFNYVTARDVLNDAVNTQLDSAAQSRLARIQDGVAGLEALAVTIGSDLGVARALGDLGDGYRALDTTLTDAQVGELRAGYEAGIAARTPPGVEGPSVDEMFPSSDRAQYLQYQYLLRNPHENRADLVDAADGSSYSAAHAEHHPTLRLLSEALFDTDMLLIDADSSSVVYSVDKRADFGTDLARGPHRDSALADAVLNELRDAAAGEAVIVDFERYEPAGRVATLFVAAEIRDQGREIGAIAFEVPIELLNAVTTANEDWEGSGLGETGEFYIVGADGLMRSDSRFWLQEPDAYLEAAADAGYGEDVTVPITAYGTTVLAQPVETDAVAAALLGDRFEGTTRNYLGDRTITVAEPLSIEGLQWVGVAEASIDETGGVLRRLIRNLLILAAVLIPAIAVIAVVASRRLLKPVDPIIEAANAVGDGALDVELPIRGRGEFSDLAGKFNAVVDTLREQQTELLAAEAETTEMLMAVMPSRLAEQVKRGDRSVAEAVRGASVISVTVIEPGVVDALEQQALADHTVAISAGIAKLAGRHGAELLRSSASEHLYATGLTSDGMETDQAIAFAAQVREWVVDTSERSGLGFEFRAGIAAGDVLAGVVGSERIAFGVWGAPRRKATELAAVAEDGQILVDPTVAGAIGHTWLVEPLVGLVDIGGATLDGWRVIGRRPAGTRSFGPPDVSS